MQAPKRKTSKSRRNMRRAHDALTPAAASKCAACGEIKSPHHICPACGMDRGRKYERFARQAE